MVTVLFRAAWSSTGAATTPTVIVLVVHLAQATVTISGRRRLMTALQRDSFRVGPQQGWPPGRFVGGDRQEVLVLVGERARAG